MNKKTVFGAAVAAYESAKADVNVSEANLTEARLALSYTTVRSPISGYISERHVDIGTLVGSGAQSLLANVVKSDTVLVEFNEAKTRENLALVGLYKALGGGWNERSIVPVRNPGGGARGATPAGLVKRRSDVLMQPTPS